MFHLSSQTAIQFAYHFSSTAPTHLQCFGGMPMKGVWWELRCTSSHHSAWPVAVAESLEKSSHQVVCKGQYVNVVFLLWLHDVVMLQDKVVQLKLDWEMNDRWNHHSIKWCLWLCTFFSWKPHTYSVAIYLCTPMIKNKISS